MTRNELLAACFSFSGHEEQIKSPGHPGLFFPAAMR